MSRCFPYIPRGYKHQSANNESLIGSIKLQTEKEKEIKKREKKDDRKERKEKRKERKEKRKGRKEKKDKINLNMNKSDVLKDHTGLKACLEPKDELFCQRREDSKCDLIDQSTLTEEHGHPDSLPGPSSSYDSTENSNKRKRHSDSSQGHGKILIRLPSKRGSEFHSLATGQQSCLLSRQTNSCAQHKDDTPLIRDKSCNIEICSTSGVLNPMQVLESQYNFLLEKDFGEEANSIYPPADSDWLFQGQVEKRQRLGSESMPCSTVWANAHYLHQVEAYALPYVVPY